MDKRLQRQLKPVARRFRSVRVWRLLTCLWLLLAAVGGYLLWNRGVYALPGETILLLGSAFAGALVLTCLGLLSYRNLYWIAQQVERAHPTLQERLVTAVEMRPTAQSGAYGYLQNSVLQETLSHARRHNWKATVPFSRVAMAQLGNWAAFLLMFAVMATLFTTTPPTTVAQADSNSTAIDAPADFEIKVEPGDTEIEKGSSLIVVARFGGDVPKEATLVYSSTDDDTENRISMSRSLDDPLFGGHVFSVDNDIAYRVEYADTTTREFKIGVFEYPELVRADATLKYPSYTQMDDKTIEDTRRVTAVEGTELTWTCHLNKRVDGAFLHDKDGNEIELFAASDESLAYSATIPMLETKRWKLFLIDAVGRENKSPPELVGKVVKNKPADLKLALARDLRVSPVEEVEVQATTWDDFGVAKYGIAYSLAGNTEEIVLGESAAGKEQREANHLLDFEALDAEPDQLLSYYFWAEDYAADGKPRRTMSDMFFAEVRHFEEIFRQGQQPPGGEQQQQQQQQQQSQNERQAEQLANLQKQIVTGTWNVMRRETDTEPSNKFQDDVSLLIESQQSALDQAEAMAEELTDEKSKAFIQSVRDHMNDAIDELTRAHDGPAIPALAPALAAEQAAYQSLLRLRAREHEVVEQQQSQSSQSQQSQSQSQQNRFQQQLQQLELKNDENRYETERQAEQQEDAQQREMRQIVNRLKELARRQEDLNKQVSQLQSALEKAETQEEREEIERQLKRLRDQQQQMLRDVDELADRMDQQQNQQQMQEAREQLEQTRESVQQATQALEQGNVSQALSAGTRAERELKQMRDDLRQETANQFSEELREMREKARDLDETQQTLSERLQSMDQNRQPTLRDKSDRAEIAQSLQDQKQDLEDLLNQMKETVEEAEATEPLLARKLYDSYRETKQRKVEQALETSEELLNRGLDPQSRELERSASEGISDLREDIENAAEGVLGDETEALRRALGELDQLSEALNNEIAQATGNESNDPQQQPGQQQPGQQQPGQQQPGQQQPGQQQPGQQQPGQQQPGQQQPGQQQPGQQQPGQQQPGQQQPGQQQPGQQQPGQQQPGQQQPGQQQPGQQQPGQQQPGQQQPGQQQPGQQQPGQQQPGQQQPGQQQPGQQQPGQQQPGQQQPGQQQPGQQQPGQQQPGQQQPGQQQPGQQQPGQQQPGQQQPGQQQPGQQQPGKQQPGQQQPGQQQPGQQQPGQQQPGQQRRSLDQLQEARDGGGGLQQYANDSRGSAPITGADFRDWSDRLRDVEEMIEDPELAAEAARIRDRARGFRIEFNRTGGEPKWRLVEEMVATPLQELRQQVSHELLRRAGDKNKLVPIDRDPVPSEFADSVRKYYERLGAGQ